jgi:Ca2+-binding EF-hand superfamily protein
MTTRAMFGMGVLSLGMMAMAGVAPAQEHRGENLPNPMQAIRLAQEVGRAMFIAADVNHDGLLSQKEAIDANNTLVGGFFFQADRDGNGVVTQEEAKAVEEYYLSQNSWARYVVESLRAQQRNPQNNTNVPDPIQSFTALVDSNNDKQIQATEVRELVQTTTQSIFAAADTNRDGQMSPAEINAAIAGALRAIGQYAFQRADTDNNGQLSREEYDKAIIEPANVAFQIMDLDHNGQISMQEAQQLERTVISQVRMLQLPEPPNSPTNLIESGKLPSEAAPVPSFTTPNPGQRRQQPAPAPAPARRAQPPQPQ